MPDEDKTFSTELFSFGFEDLMTSRDAHFNIFLIHRRHSRRRIICFQRFTDKKSSSFIVHRVNNLHLE